MSIRKTSDLGQAIAEIEAWHSDVVYELEDAEKILTKGSDSEDLEELKQLIDEALELVQSSLNQLR